MNERLIGKTPFVEAMCVKPPPVVTWDLDEVLEKTQVSAIAALNEHPEVKGVYEPPIRKWWQLSDWLVEQEGWDYAKARALEALIWRDPKVLASGDPNALLSWASWEMSHHGISQHVVTGREPDPVVDKVTRAWVSYVLPWVPDENVHIRNDTSLTSPEFKAKTVKAVGARLHVEDSVSDAEIVAAMTDAWVVFVPHEEDLGKLQHECVVTISDLVAYMFELQRHQPIDVYGNDMSARIVQTLQNAMEYGW